MPTERYETIQHQLSQLPRRSGAAPRLHMLKEVHRWIKAPGQALKVVHIMGRNGKGSTGAMVAEVLKSAQYRVGRLSIPAIKDNRDMVQINGVSISKANFLTSYDTILAALVAHGGDQRTLNQSEWWLLVALDYFKRQEVQYVVLESLLYQAYDPSQVVEAPILVAFTKVNPEVSKHPEVALAAIKPEAYIISYPGQDEKVDQALQARAEAVGANWIDNQMTATVMRCEPRGMLINVGSLEGVRLSLTGSYQVKNLTTAYAILDVLRHCGAFVSDLSMAEGFAHVKIPGRMEYDPENNLLYDGASDYQGVLRLIDAVKQWHLPVKPIFVVGLMESHDAIKMLEEILPQTRQMIVVRPDHEDGMSADALAAHIVMHSNIDVEIADDAEAALSLARRVRQNSQAMIIVTGSFYTLRAIHGKKLVDVDD